MSIRETIFQEINEERERQVKKWGHQSHPSFMKDFSLFELLKEHNVPHEDVAKTACDIAFEHGFGTWTHILLEEVCEVVGTCEKSKEELQKELIQTAAVIVSWLEDLNCHEK